MTLKVLVTGATGKQGGAVARALLARGHQVRGLTRNVESAAAGELRGLGAEVVAGNFDDQASLEAAARGVDAVFIVSTPFEAGMEAETRQGIAAVDAAVRAGAGHIVYTSVAGADQATGIPHFDSKYQVEQRLAAQGVPYTIIAPVYFMENLFFENNVQSLRQGALVMALPAERALQQVAVEDIGSFGALALERRAELSGRRIELASDELSNARAAELLSAALERPIAYVELPLDQVRAFSEDLALMYGWFDRVGYSVDIDALRRDYPEVGWQRYDEWLRRQDLAALSPAPALG